MSVYRTRTPEERARNTANARLWRARNRERLRNEARAWRAADPAKARQAQRRWFAKNMEKNREDCRRYRAANLERERERNRRWGARNPDLVHASTARRRARLLSALVEAVDRRKVFERDGYICQICGEPTSGAYPEPLCPTVDHIVPLSKGGAHSYANTQCAHYGCNARKGATSER